MLTRYDILFILTLYSKKNNLIISAEQKYCLSEITHHPK